VTFVSCRSLKLPTTLSQAGGGSPALDVPPAA
jgi:hypothetical protein